MDCVIYLAIDHFGLLPPLQCFLQQRSQWFVDVHTITNHEA